MAPKSGNPWARGKYRKQAEKELSEDVNRKTDAAKHPDQERSAYYEYGDMPRGKRKNEMYTRAYQEYDKANDPKKKSVVKRLNEGDPPTKRADLKGTKKTVARKRTE